MATRSDSRNCQGFAHTGCMPLPCSGRLTVTCDPDSLATLLANFSLLKEVPRGGQGSGMCWPDGPGRSWVGLSQEAEQVGSLQHSNPSPLFPPSCITGQDLEPDGGDGAALQLLP